MNILEIILVGLSLAMDAFAVSICKGLTIKKNYKKSLIIASYFGLFQAIMPLIGFFLGTYFKYYIENIDHWISFVILLFIGTKMIKDAIINDNNYDDSIEFKVMSLLAIATSLDALAIGISLSFLNVNILSSIIIIGIITFIVCFLGSILGSKIGQENTTKYQIIGGFILIMIGLKILFEHLKIII